MTKSLRFIFHFILQERRFLFLGLICTGVVSTLAWLGPKMIERIIDRGVIPHDLGAIQQGVLLLACVELGRLASVFLSQLTYASLGQNVIERVRGRMIAHLMKVPVSYFDRVTSGSMMTRVVSDVNSLTDFFQSGFVSILGNAASIVAIFFGLWTIHPKLGLILTLGFLPMAFAAYRFSSILRVVYELTRTQLSNLNSMLADFLFGMKTIRSLGMNPSKYRDLSRQVRSYADAQMKMVKTNALFHPTLTLGIGTLILLLILFGLPLVESHVLLVGGWVAALSYIVSLQQPLTEISDRWNFFLAGLTSIDRIRRVFHERREAMGSLTPKSFEEIHFNGVSFHYDGGSEVLNHVELKLKRGEWVGIYGESGSGKSTLLQMIYGFYPPSEGRLLWNSTSYSEYNLHQLRSHFGVVEQFPFLFTGTIRDNITLYGEHVLDAEELQEKFAGFTLIESLLMNLDLEVNERGNNLSMGQKQMIAFLRAYLSRPSIWILDEATAFFDAEAEKEVLQALERNRGTITVIQVAHRPEALESMNRLLRMDRGLLLPEKSLTKDLR